MYIHEHENWWQFRFDNEKLLNKLAAVRAKQGFLLGKMSSIGFSLQNEAVLETQNVHNFRSIFHSNFYFYGSKIRFLSLKLAQIEP